MPTPNGKDEQTKYYKIVEEKAEYTSWKMENDQKGLAGVVMQLGINRLTHNTE